MSTHTPGPWEYEESAMPGCWIVGKPNCGALIAASIDNVDDARLIAAAPELLTLLSHAVHYGGLKEGWWLDEARAAIAKAKGESV